jgi:hypothetical protein
MDVVNAGFAWSKNRPRSDRTAVLRIGEPSEALVQTTHVPAHLYQAMSPSLDDSLGQFALSFKACALFPSFNQRRSSKELCPAIDDFLLSPFACTRLIHMDNQVLMIATYRDVRNAELVRNIDRQMIAYAQTSIANIDDSCVSRSSTQPLRCE